MLFPDVVQSPGRTPLVDLGRPGTLGRRVFAKITKVVVVLSDHGERSASDDAVLTALARRVR